MIKVTFSIEASPADVSMTDKTRTIEHDQHLAFGRGDAVDWKLEDARKVISSLHCTVEPAQGEFFLHDKSTNGTFLNGSENRMDGPHKLANGDTVKIGTYQFGVALVEGSEAEVKPAITADNIWSVAPLAKSAVEDSGGGRGDDPALMAKMRTSDPETATRGGEGMTVIRPGPPPARKPEAKEADVDAKGATNADQNRLEALCFTLARELDKLGQQRSTTMQILGSRSALLLRNSHADDHSKRVENWVSYFIANGAEPLPGIEKITADFTGEEKRLLGAINVAVERMAGAVAPPPPEVAQGDTKLQAWFARYQMLWGETAEDWNSGFVRAFLIHLAAAFDETSAP